MHKICKILKLVLCSTFRHIRYRRILQNIFFHCLWLCANRWPPLSQMRTQCLPAKSLYNAVLAWAHEMKFYKRIWSGGCTINRSAGYRNTSDRVKQLRRTIRPQYSKGKNDDDDDEKHFVRILNFTFSVAPPKRPTIRRPVTIWTQSKHFLCCYRSKAWKATQQWNSLVKYQAEKGKIHHERELSDIMHWALTKRVHIHSL